LQEQHSLSGPRPGESTSWVQVPHGTLHPGLSPVAKSSGQAAAPVMRATLPRLRETPQGVTVKRRSEVPAEAQDSSLSASYLLSEPCVSKKMRLRKRILRSMPNCCRIIQGLLNTTTAADVNVTGNLACGFLEVTGNITSQFPSGINIGSLSTIKFFQTFVVNFNPTSNPFDVVVSNVGNGVNSFHVLVQVIQYSTAGDAFTTKIVQKDTTSFTVRVRRVDSASFGTAPQLQVFLLGHP
jgi:hypothetical protein